MIDCFRRSRFTPTDRLSIAMTTLTTASKPHHDVIPELNRNNTAKKTTGSVGDCKPTGRVFKKKKKGCVWGMRWNPPGRHIQPLGGFFFFFFMCPQGILPGTQGENLSLSSPLHTNQVAPLFSFGRWTPRRKKKTFSFFFSILKKVQVKRLPSGPSTRHFVINPTPPALTTPTSQTTTFWRARKREQWPRECAWPNRRVNSSFVLILLEKGKRGTSKILTSWWRTQNSFERWPTLLCRFSFFGGNTKKKLVTKWKTWISRAARSRNA